MPKASAFKSYLRGCSICPHCVLHGYRNPRATFRAPVHPVTPRIEGLYSFLLVYLVGLRFLPFATGTVVCLAGHPSSSYCSLHTLMNDF